MGDKTPEVKGWGSVLDDDDERGMMTRESRGMCFLAWRAVLWRRGVQSEEEREGDGAYKEKKKRRRKCRRRTPFFAVGNEGYDDATFSLLSINNTINNK